MEGRKEGGREGVQFLLASFLNDYGTLNASMGISNLVNTIDCNTNTHTLHIRIYRMYVVTIFTVP